MNQFLLIGLGNIGAEYAQTRHNIGFDILDKLANLYQSPWASERYAFYTKFRIKNKIIHAIKPTTYMNLSGKAYRYWLDKLKLSVEDSLVLVDDLALPLSQIRLKPSGSHGGHNGLKHIEEVLNTNTYPRLRFGIGNQFIKGFQVDFVLGKWSNDEIEPVQIGITKAIEAIEATVLTSLPMAMNTFNKK
ncbi:MAG: aminoacyl-tRNA hydrolase [Chitinophagales bacterium]|jgi:PTH1 family peptidyl-tRNA hydrolase|nr:aminoacyl-tRNA hydrolase [Chitinophagales bacterium]